MSGLDNREKAYEDKFIHEEAIKFKIASKRRNLMGLWAAEKLGLNKEESTKYALEIVNFGIEDQTSGAVINKILNDLKSKNIEITENQVRDKNIELEELARRQILA